MGKFKEIVSYYQKLFGQFKIVATSTYHAYNKDYNIYQGEGKES